MTLSRRQLLLASAALPVAASAQSDWRRNAVPYYSPSAFIEGVWRGFALPRAQAFASASAALVAALQARADYPTAGDGAARRAWMETLRAWSALNAVAIGPLIERRSARRIDFSPVRPQQVALAIERLAGNPQLAPDTVGAAAKGMGALEWLLWQAQAPSDPAARAYAVFAARDVADEARAILQAMSEGAAKERSEEEGMADFSEILNQWIGGLEALRMGSLERSHSAGHLQRRTLSGGDKVERAARWASLRALTDFTAGANDYASIETLLRGRGLNRLADRLVRASAQVQASMVGAQASQGAAGAKALRDLKRLAESDVMSALDVKVGFSDADGD